MIESIIDNSIIHKAIKRDIVKVNIIDLREYSQKKYKQIDDNPFGGGAGMVMMAKPLFEALDFAINKINNKKNMKIIFPNPQGELWNHTHAKENSKSGDLIFICGHYKGIDERVVKKYVTHQYSLGDYILSNGELSSMILIDSLTRLIPGVLNTSNSAKTDSFYRPLLDAPYYTHPREIEGLKVPEILLSGNHKKIEEWRNNKREKRTMLKRPDLWKIYNEENKSEYQNE